MNILLRHCEVCEHWYSPRAHHHCPVCCCAPFVVAGKRFHVDVSTGRTCVRGSWHWQNIREHAADVARLLDCQ